MKAVKSVLVAFAFFSLLSSCQRKNALDIVLDTSDPLALAPDIRWAVVVEPYAAFREEISWDAEASDYCKQGELFPILASALASEENGGETWYRFKEGWLPASVLAIYPNKYRALKAADSLGGKR